MIIPHLPTVSYSSFFASVFSKFLLQALYGQQEAFPISVRAIDIRMLSHKPYRLAALHFFHCASFNCPTCSVNRYIFLFDVGQRAGKAGTTPFFSGDI